jgi:hypothetical protein
MKRLVLLACHRDPFVVANRIRLLKNLGEHDVHLLYGGREGLFSRFIRSVRRLSGTNVAAYCIRGRSPFWKWAHTDLAVLEWFRAAGRSLSFEAAIVLEWDIVPYAPINELYSHIPQDGVGLTGLTRLASVEHAWPWLAKNQPYREEWSELREWARREYGLTAEPQVCIGPGKCLPREFLERYASVTVPDLCHEELRLPLVAQALGFRLYDTGLYRSWTDPDEQRIFNSDRRAISRGAIRSELAKAEGRRVFHPVRRVVATSGGGGSLGTPAAFRLDARDRLMIVGSAALALALAPGRRGRTYWGRLTGKVLGRRTWPAAPRSVRSGSWHE